MRFRRIDRLASFEPRIHPKIIVSPYFKVSCTFLVRWDVSAGDSCAGELLRFLIRGMDKVFQKSCLLRHNVIDTMYDVFQMWSHGMANKSQIKV